MAYIWNKHAHAPQEQLTRRAGGPPPLHLDSTRPPRSTTVHAIDGRPPTHQTIKISRSLVAARLGAHWSRPRPSFLRRSSLPLSPQPHNTKKHNIPRPLALVDSPHAHNTARQDPVIVIARKKSGNRDGAQQIELPGVNEPLSPSHPRDTIVRYNGRSGQKMEIYCVYVNETDKKEQTATTTTTTTSTSQDG